MTPGSTFLSRFVAAASRAGRAETANINGFSPKEPPASGLRKESV